MAKPDKAGLDVYAQSYIPQQVLRVNTAPSMIISSKPVASFDAVKYVSSFAGSVFLNGEQRHSSQVMPHQSPPSTNGTATPTLSSRDYHAYFQHCLAEERIAQQQQCEQHALYDVPLHRPQPMHQLNDPFIFVLQVPGLRELTLRIDIGDIVRLRQLHLGPSGEVVNGYGTDGGLVVEHDATVWRIDRFREVLILQVEQLRTLSMRFNVMFTVQTDRINDLFRATHRSHGHMMASGNDWLRSMLFPDLTDGVEQHTLNAGVTDLEFYDQALNYEQIRAVDTILRKDYGRIPYVISGPPGTGKTKTLVETALQLSPDNEQAHLLVCAPSDQAADTLVQRLSKHLMPSDMLRLNAPSRTFAEVPDTVLMFCNIDGELFALPAFATLMKYRIIVTTCRDAQILIDARVTNIDLHHLEQGLLDALHPGQSPRDSALHWTGLLLDEAAQAMEPEALIPMLVVVPPKSTTQSRSNVPLFVMAGDQHQLGPRTASRASSLQTSLFQRISERPLYSEHPLARSRQTKGSMRPLTTAMLPILRPPFANLIRNYRSHPAILAVPSALFYHDTLTPEYINTDFLSSWSGWQGRRWPVLFAVNLRPDEVEQDGGGWYNKSEAIQACEYAKSLVTSGQLQPQDICIMSPFRAQVRLIRAILRKESYTLAQVNVGPLEAFQGLESMLVILCTTRTRERFVASDVAQGTGVIHEPRRFNVALTRAKHGLIVLGNPAVLEQDPSWRSFLAFCRRNDLVTGQLGISDALDGQDKRPSRLEQQLIWQDSLRDDEEADVAHRRPFGRGRTAEDDFLSDAIRATQELSLSDHEDDNLE